MAHLVNVKTKYYLMLKSGQKTIELRLWDNWRQKMRTGDAIVFSDSSRSADRFDTRIKALHRAQDFVALSRLIDPRAAGFASHGELISALSQFYPAYRQKQFGVVGIEVYPPFTNDNL
jgi:ASC-1-like (ASCH) protein